MERSKHYIATVENNVEGLSFINHLRIQMRVLNKYSKLKRRVIIRGRQAKQKETRFIYGRKTTQSYDNCGNIIGGISNAKRFDIYIYNR